MTKIRIKTTEGDILVRLYDETPKHRDNFLKLAKEGYFDGTLPPCHQRLYDTGRRPR